MMRLEMRIPLFAMARLALIHAWRTSRILFIALIVSSGLMCAAQILEIAAMRSFFDGVTKLADGSVTRGDVLKPASLLIFVLLCNPAVEIVEYLAQGYFWRRGNGYMQSLFHLRVGKMKLIEFDKAETLDAMKRATLANSAAPAASRTLIQLTFYYLPFFIFASAYLCTIKPSLVFATIAVFVPVLISELCRASNIYRLEDEISNLKRRKDYFESCIVSREYSKETRTLGAFGYFFDLFSDSVKTLGREILRVEKKASKLEARLQAVNILGYGGVIGLLLSYLMSGSISVGVFATVYYSLEKIRGVLRGMVADAGEAVQNLTATSFLFDFIGGPAEEKRDEPFSKTEDIHVKDVSFAYPDAKTDAVSHISLDIRRGETLAIVGENGSGKTTLAKLIVGLYEPSSGSVMYGDKDIGEYGMDSLYESVSGVFQEYGKYKMTLRENVQISDMTSKEPPDPYLEMAKVSLAKCGQGLNTVLSREFRGAELSGGEWQRVAIARGFYRSYDLIILDEPTAAIDPIEESDIFRTFRDATRDKTAVLVTHRLGSAKIADRIAVMDGGRIAELGTHNELMSRKGLYHSMFLEQSKWYIR